MKKKISGIALNKTVELHACRAAAPGVKPAWLALCFSLSSLRAAAGFLLTRGNDGLIFGRDFEGTGNSMALL